MLPWECPRKRGLFSYQFNETTIKKILLTLLLFVLGLVAVAVFDPQEASGHAQNSFESVYFDVFEEYYPEPYFEAPTAVLWQTDVRQMVLDMVEDAGYSRYIADAVIQCESGWNTNAVGDHGQSWGLWQIHQPAHAIGNDAFDPYDATVYAIKLLDKNGWYPWTCYKKLF